MKRATQVLIVVALIGSGVGIGITIGSQRSTASALAHAGLSVIAEFEAVAHRGYQNKNPEVGIWALRELTSLLEDEGRLPLLKATQSPRGLHVDMVLAHTRLALLLRETGRAEEAAAEMQKALQKSPSAWPNETITEERLLEMVKTLNENREPAGGAYHGPAGGPANAHP